MTKKLVSKRKQSIHGLKQSSDCWNSTLDIHLNRMGFVQTTSNQCLYLSSEGDMSMVRVHVDIILAEKSNKQIEEVKKAQAQRIFK